MLDFYAAKSNAPTPVAIYIYGGGFTRGDKRGLRAEERDTLLAAGISVAAINYRHASQVPLPAAFHDGARAVQYLRARAAEWHIDKSRVAVWGGSAGDPPVMMTYGMAPTDPLPAEAKKVGGWQVHHVMFGVKLKERMDELGIESVLKYPGAQSKYPNLIAFMIEKLAAEKSAPAPLREYREYPSSVDPR